MGRPKIKLIKKKPPTSTVDALKFDATIQILKQHIQDLTESGAINRPRFRMAIEAIKSAVEMMESGIIQP